MDSIRQYPRIKLNLHCRLIGRDGEEYTGSLVNISLGGALINADTQTHFKVGDLYDMILILNSEERPTRRTCEIIWMDNEHLGVKYLSRLPDINLEF